MEAQLKEQARTALVAHYKKKGLAGEKLQEAVAGAMKVQFPDHLYVLNEETREAVLQRQIALSKLAADLYDKAKARDFKDSALMQLLSEVWRMADDLKGWFEKKLESGEADIAEEGDQLELPEPSMPSKKTVEMRRCGPLVKTHGGKVIVMPRREDPAA